MKKSSLKIFEEITYESSTVSELADKTGMDTGWISKVVKELEEQNLVSKEEQEILVADTYEAKLLHKLTEKYNLEQIVVDSKEDILIELLKPKTLSEMEKEGFSKTTFYRSIKDLKSVGIVEKKDGKYKIISEDLKEFLKARIATAENVYTAENQEIRVLDKNREFEGELTAFSKFQRYGIDYYPAKKYFFQGDEDLGINEVFVHALKTAKTKKQNGMVAIFYLRHKGTVDEARIWSLVKKWDCVEKWADILAYIDQRQVKNSDLFLPWKEFTELANEYDVFPRGKHRENSLLKGLKDLGAQLENRTDVYLLGGGNLILRGLKDSTKDIDIVVKEEKTFKNIAENLTDLGYSERTSIENAYNKMNPSIILEKKGFPRWDIFVNEVAGNLHLTEDMMERSDHQKKFGKLRVHLVSLTDIFLFKSITEREGDLEDMALIAQETEMDWSSILKELPIQEEITGQMFSFSVLDRLDILEERYGIQSPIKNKLISYCLENALLLSLKEKPKTIKELRNEIDFADHQIYNKLQKLENKEKINVDREGKLNKYFVQT